MVPLAVAVGEGVRGGPPWTVTSGVAVALGVGLGASTHLVTLWPLAAAVVVQNEPCARAPGARIRTAIMDNEVNTNSFLTDVPPLSGWLQTTNLNETGARINTDRSKERWSLHHPDRRSGSNT